MQQSTRIVAAMALAGAALLAETAPPEPQTVHALLAEVRALRQDLRMAIVTAERMQIVLFRLQVQEMAVSRASQKLDEVRGQLSQIEESKKTMAARIQEMEEQVRVAQEPNMRQTFAGQIIGLRSMVQRWEAEIPVLQAKESEALGQLQGEQARLAELQDSLDRLDKGLDRLK